MTNLTPIRLHPNVAEENDQPENKKPYRYFETSQLSIVHHFYLSEAVGEPSEYVDMIHKIKMAGPNDVIYIYLNTPGGQLDTGIQIINAMQNTRAKVITVLESESHSLGTIIFLSGDEFIVNDDCLMMFHNYAGGTWGKGNEQVAQLDATIKWFNKLARDIYIPFLTEEELNQVINGKDMWMDSDEITKRLKNMVKILTEEATRPKKRKAKKKGTKKKK